MFAITHNDTIPLIVKDEQGTEQSSTNIEFVLESTESSRAKVDEIYVEIKPD